MSLTRSFLSGMGLTTEQISAIIDAHTDTVDALKEQRDSYKADADKLKEVQKELETSRVDAEEVEKWRTKYNDEHKAFDEYKADVETKATKSAKENAYRDLLIKAGVSEKRLNSILKIADIENIELDEKGAVKGADKVVEGIKSEWADFITSSDTKGAPTDNPPSNDTASAFNKMSLTEKMAYANEHPNDASVIAWLK